MMLKYNSEDFEKDVDEMIVGFKKYMDDTESDDFLVIVLKGHLYVEHELTELIKMFLENEEYFKNNTFKSKLDFARALGVIKNDWYPSLNKLNNLRNKYAHNLFYELTEDDYDDFRSVLTVDIRSFFSEVYDTLEDVYGESFQTKMRILIGCLWFFIRHQQKNIYSIKEIQYYKIREKMEQTEIERLKTKNEKLEAEREKLNSEIMEMSLEKAELQLKIEGIRAETAEIELKVARAKSEADRLKSEKSKLESKRFEV